jgi:hypothetical protein
MPDGRLPLENIIIISLYIIIRLGKTMKHTVDIFMIHEKKL